MPFGVVLLNPPQAVGVEQEGGLPAADPRFEDIKPLYACFVVVSGQAFMCSPSWLVCLQVLLCPAQSAVVSRAQRGANTELSKIHFERIVVRRSRCQAGGARVQFEAVFGLSRASGDHRCIALHWTVVGAQIFKDDKVVRGAGVAARKLFAWASSLTSRDAAVLGAVMSVTLAQLRLCDLDVCAPGMLRKGCLAGCLAI